MIDVTRGLEVDANKRLDQMNMLQENKNRTKTTKKNIEKNQQRKLRLQRPQLLQ